MKSWVYTRDVCTNKKSEKIYYYAERIESSESSELGSATIKFICATEITREKHADSLGPFDPNYLIIIEPKIGEFSAEKIIKQIITKKLTQLQIDHLLYNLDLFENLRKNKDKINIQDIRYAVDSELGMWSGSARPKPPATSRSTNSPYLPN